MAIGGSIMISKNELYTLKIKDLYHKYPQVSSYFSQLSLPVISEYMTLSELFESIAVQWLRDLGTTQEDIINVIQNIIYESENQNKEIFETANCSITILPGTDKNGNTESFTLTANSGNIFAVTGPTGSGKTRFLEDIEYIACGDSPTKRKVLVNGKLPSENQREFYETNLCASLSQSMNFVMELNCRDFIKLHSECRKAELPESEKEALVDSVLECANSLCGEQIFPDTMITQLSGGQSRSLMIADVALVSDSPIVLIDEPENAGVDKNAIINLLAAKGKIVFVSTHDPVIALSCPERIVIKNGAISSILKRTKEEEKLLEKIKLQDERIKQIRSSIREGKYVC